MELNTPQRSQAVSKTHHDAIASPRRLLERVGKGPSHRQGVISNSAEALRQTGKQFYAGVVNCADSAMNSLGRANHAPAGDGRDTLMTEADTEGRAISLLQEGATDTEVLFTFRVARARRHDDCIHPKLCYVLMGERVVRYDDRQCARDFGEQLV